jgi:hypothetical protein
VSYTLRYYINWQARTGDLLTVNIYKKDFVGSSSELRATDKPFILSKQEEDPIAPIQATKAIVEFYNNGNTPLSTFFSEDDTMWRVDFTKRDGTLIWRGFVTQDDCAEEFQSAPYKVQLAANDGLALLKGLVFNTAADNAGYTDIQTWSGTLIAGVLRIESFPIDPAILPGDMLTLDGIEYEILSTDLGGSANRIDITLVTFPANGVYTVGLRIRQNYLSRISIFSYLRVALFNTSLELDQRTFFNYFDTTHNEAIDPFKQTRIFSDKWLDSDGIWDNCYKIIEDILTALNCSLVQSGGYWNVIHWPELFQLPGNVISGFLNDAQITDSLNYPGEFPLMDANAVRKITSTYATVKETFNYNQPKQLINGADLKLLGALTGSSTTDGIRYDHYSIPSQWKHLNSDPDTFTFDASYIVVETDIANEVEIDRYIYQPWIDRTYKAVQFNSIEVTKDDVIDFSLNLLFRSTDGTDTAFFRVRFLLITATGSLYDLVHFDGGSPDGYLRWNNIVTDDPAGVDAVWKTTLGVGVIVNQDLVNSQQYNLSSIGEDQVRPPVPGFPEAGILLISIQGVTTSDSGTGSPACDTSFNDIQLTIESKIADSTRITGHSHLQDAQTGAKKKYDEEIQIDDSPRNPIGGTLFIDLLTSYAANIGNSYSTKTSAWGYSGATKDKRIGYIATTERQAIFAKPRTRIEGTFLFDISFNLLSVFFFPTLPDLNFILGVVNSLDFMQMQGQAEFNELYETGDSFTTYLYTFQYIYETK